MDDKKKILLGEKDIMSRENEDLFLNINLNSTFSELRDNTYTNVFDIEKQFKKERNASRDFRIYGIIDSTTTDSDNLSLYIYSKSGTTGLTDFVKSTNSSEMVYGGFNAFGKKRGKFIIELTGYTEDFVFIKILSNNLTFQDQIFTQQLIFKDSDGLFVEYGIKTIDISDSGDIIEINNDFYFLYNKHWVKKDLLIIEEKPAKVSLSGMSDIGQITEIPNADLIPVITEGNSTNDSGSVVISNNTGITSSLYPITVYLNKPSPFGLENVNLKIEGSSLTIVNTSTISPTNELIVTNDSFDTISVPYTVNFSVGEMSKVFYVFSPEDSIQEFLEDVTFGLDNFQNVETANTLTHTVEVIDTTERNKVILNFQDIYENRNYFYGQVFYGVGGASYFSAPMPAVVRNGLNFSGTPMEFYPIDKFNIKIKNVGVDTIFPANPKLNITSEQLFKSGTELIFTDIIQEYVNSEKHSIKLTFSSKRFSNTQGVNFNSNNQGFTINGIPIVSYFKSYKFDYDTILGCLKKEAFYGSTIKMGGWDIYDLETPFNIINEDPTTLSFVLESKSPGVRLDIAPYGFSVPGTIYDSMSTLAISTITAETIQSFVQSAQTPLEIVLGANFNNNLNARYEINFFKKGYDGMSFTTSPLPASLNPDKYYLISGLNTMLRNWNDSTNSAVYNHDNVVDTNLGYQLFANNYNFGQYKIGDVYVNGALFLSNLYLDNTANNYLYNPGQQSLNVSHAINSANNFAHDFLPAPIVTIPETREFYSVNDVSQIGYLRILKPNFGTSVTPPSNIYPHRSFEFRTGDTGAYNTYFTDDYNSYGAWFITGSFGAGFKSSGGTISTTNSTNYNTLKTYFENGKPSPLITDQGVKAYATAYGPNPAADLAEALSLDSGNNPIVHVDGPASISFIKLESKTAGVPFYINNVVEMRYVYGLADYTKNSINYYEARPNQIAGSTINLANNHMGGYSLTRPSTPIPPLLLNVSFEQSFYSVPSSQQVKISLDSASVNGNESVTVNVGGSAVLGFHYTAAQTMPVTLTWAAGEQDKYITFTNISPILPFPKSLNLSFSNLVNLNLGTNPFTQLNLI
ncbi:hypothetical protein KBD45_04335 [Candidatus Dojkabacteria bacterium]|nr:hypothetical protein [Candidatus Dojkabacteria bacterium]